MCPIAIIVGDRGRFGEAVESIVNYKFRTEAEVWEWWDKSMSKEEWISKYLVLLANPEMIGPKMLEQMYDEAYEEGEYDRRGNEFDE